MFNQEFEGLPYEIQIALRARLEEVIRMIYARHNSSLRSNEFKNFTKEEISGMIFAVFDLAQRLKNPLPSEDTPQD